MQYVLNIFRVAQNGYNTHWDLGWFALDFMWVISNCLVTCENIFDIKLGPRSVWMVYGSPTFMKTFTRAPTIFFSDTFCKVMASGNMMDTHIIVRIYLYLNLVLSRDLHIPNHSTERFFHSRYGLKKGYGNVLARFSNLLTNLTGSTEFSSPPPEWSLANRRAWWFSPGLLSLPSVLLEVICFSYDSLSVSSWYYNLFISHQIFFSLGFLRVPPSHQLSFLVEILIRGFILSYQLREF